MGQMFINPEYRTTVKKLGFIFILGFLLLCIFSYVFITQVNAGILRQDQIMTGIFIKNHPEAENEIMQRFRSGSFDDYQKTGEQFLDKYGYSSALSPMNRPVLKDLFGLMVFFAAVFCLLIGGIVFILLYRNYRNLYGRLRYIAKCSENVVEGNIEYLPSEGEGDFAKLAHSFNQMAERVKAGMDKERNEKEFLKNAISDISHQIRTPLASVMMFHELIMENRDMDEATREDFIDKGQTQLQRIQWLVESLLKMAMLESKTIDFTRDNVYAIDILEKCAAALSNLSKEKNITVLVDAKEDILLNCDEKWTAEACINIIKNALEHTRQNGIVRISSETGPLFTRITIKDNGEGIDKKDLPHIFERFYKGGKTPGAKSVGVGLSLAKLIVEGQGGMINVKSEPGKGAEFEILFPFKKMNITKL